MEIFRLSSFTLATPMLLQSSSGIKYHARIVLSSRWRVHLRQRLSQKRYCLKFLSSKFDFEEQSAAIWRQLVETHPTAACLSSLLPFSVPRAQEFSLHRAQQHRPIVVYNPQQQVINYIRAQFKNQRLTGLSAFLSPCKIPSPQHSQSVK